MARILVLDLGTTALKAALYDEQFTMLGTARREWTYTYPAPDYIEHPAEAYWTACADAMNELLDRFGGRSEIACISVTGQSETLIGLDRDGNPLGEAIVWLDTRPREACARFAREVPARDFYAATGNPGFDPIMPLLKLDWMRAHDPERYEHTVKFLLIKEYIVYRLTGRIVGEYTVESCSGYFNIRTLRWADDLLRRAGLSAEKLPELADSRAVLRGLSPAAARALGLPAETPVVNGLLDQCASLIGAGVTDGSRITETTGTVLAIGALLDAFDPHGEMMPVLVHAKPGQYLALPNCSTAGMLLKWFRDQFMPQGAGYDAINREVEARGDRDHHLILLPHFAGRISPVSNPDACGVLYGLRLDTTRADVAAAVMESVAYLLRENLELLARRGIATREIISLGGGANSPVWLRIKADVCDKTMVTLADEESTALGCALNAAIALGMIGDADVDKYVKRRDAYAPDAARVARYDARYAQYQHLNEQLGFNEPAKP